MDRNGAVLAENKPVYSITLYLEDRTLREAVQKKWSQAKDAARRAGATERKPNLFERALSLFGYKPSLVQLRPLTRPKSMELLRAARYSVVSNIVGELSSIIGQQIPLEEARLTNHYHRRLVLPFPIVSKLDATNIARVQERGLNLPGIDMEVQPERVYPQRTLAAHVLGSLIRSDESVEGDLAYFDYKLPDYRGYSGIESSFDTELRGRAGAKSVLINNLGYRQTDTTLSPVEAGKDLTLTIDAEIQREAERALAYAAVDIPPVRGAAVVLDVRTGEVLALASVPKFDPNEWIPFLPHAIAALYTNVSVAPLRNRAIYGNYAPGSTFKIFVALAGLEAGTLDTNLPVHIEANPHVPGVAFIMSVPGATGLPSKTVCPRVITSFTGPSSSRVTATSSSRDCASGRNESWRWRSNFISVSAPEFLCLTPAGCCPPRIGCAAIKAVGPRRPSGIFPSGKERWT